MSKYNSRITGLQERLRQRITATVEASVATILESVTDHIESEIDTGMKAIEKEISGTFQDQTETAGATVAVTHEASAIEVGGPSATLVPLELMKQHIA
jgi:hypothetical protein